MARTGENIYKRKDGRWEARYIKYYDGNGKAKYGYVYGHSYAEAKGKLIGCLTSTSSSPSASDKSNPLKRFDYWLDEWLKVKKVRVKEPTYIRYRNSIENHIKPHLGKYPVERISAALIENFAQYLLENGRLDKTGGLSEKSVLDILTIVKEAIKYTNTLGISTSCQIEFIPLRCKQKEMRVLSQKESKILVSYLTVESDVYKFGIFLALYTGIRIGELCALQWKDWSFDTKTIHISKTMQRLQKVERNEEKKTHVIVVEAKSKSSHRLIPLPDFILEIASKYKQPPNCYVISTERGKFTEPRVMQYQFKKCMDLCGIKDVNFHALRHTFATRCIESGFDVKTLSEILGHSSVKITLDKYVHSSLELKRINMEKLQLF